MYCPCWWLCASFPGPWNWGEEWALTEALELGVG